MSADTGLRPRATFALEPARCGVRDRCEIELRIGNPGPCDLTNLCGDLIGGDGLRVLGQRWFRGCFVRAGGSAAVPVVVRAETADTHLKVVNLVGSVNGRPVTFPDLRLALSAEPAAAAPPPTPRPDPASRSDPETFDCFLSHNSRDRPAVRALAKSLKDSGLSVWLDEERLRPGLPWQGLLESGIRASRSIAVLVGRDGLGPWEQEQMAAALVLAVRDGRPVIPVLLGNAGALPELPLFLHGRTWVDMRPAAHRGGLSALEQLIWGITGRRPD